MGRPDVEGVEGRSGRKQHRVDRCAGEEGDAGRRRTGEGGGAGRHCPGRPVAPDVPAIARTSPSCVLRLRRRD